MGLSLVQRFGTGATIDASTPSDPKLVIKLSSLENTADGGDITGGVGVNDATALTANDADKIAAALLVLWKQKQATTDDSPTVGIYVGEPFKSFTTRNGVSQLNYSYTVNVYTPDPTANLDPDSVAIS